MNKELEKKKFNTKIILISVIVLVVLACTVCALLYFGVLHINNPSNKRYPVRGVDVSHYQGDIDWNQLSSENICFAYIKATEGSMYKDEQFDKNWNEAQTTELRIGAYHFFSLDSLGKDQAENFCNTVSSVENMLPPVVDVEPYGVYMNPDNIDKEKMLSELDDYLNGVESYYSMRPIIYTTEEWLPMLQEKFADYDLWIRSVYGKPDPSINWTFWQYSNRHVLSGYSGTERFIDMNVFYGDMDLFNDL